MAGKKVPKTPEEIVEITVSTYWPTKIIKSVTIKDNHRDSFHDSVTFDAKAARYMYEQLKLLFEGEESKK